MPFGYDWEDIKKAQQKDMSGMRKPVDMSKSGKPEATETDIKMLKELGESGIKAKGFYGVLDRLKTSSHIQNSAFERGRQRAMNALDAEGNEKSPFKVKPTGDGRYEITGAPMGRYGLYPRPSDRSKGS
jgi:hypothetical protein